MQVRGAPLIGATAAYGICLALGEDASDEALEAACAAAATRPTAINLRWALDEMLAAVRNRPREERVAPLMRGPRDLRPDVETNRRIGEHGLNLIEDIAATSPGRRSTSSPTATPAGSPPSTGARRWRRSTWRTTRGCRSTCGSTRPGRATRARR
jgi:methylthioribose-1-phosphate isomerase